MNEIDIRPAQASDFDAMWQIFQQLVAAGDSYALGPETGPEACRAYWFGPGVHSSVAVMGGARLLGMYRLAASRPGPGAHVANASFMVDPSAQGVGVGRRLGEHCLAQARRGGFLAMQFDLVVSSNVGAVVLWKRLGFDIVGTLPKAYRDRRLGYVDAYVMYRLLDDPATWPL